MMRHRLITLGIMMLSLLTGCAGAAQDDLNGQGWGTEFQSAREREKSSDFALATLADDSITDGEMAEANNLLVQCLTDAGFPDAVVDDYGGLTVPDHGLGPSIDQVVTRCEDSLGWSSISMLYQEMRRNPENVDNDALMAACLVTHGVVPADYRASSHREDLRRWLELGSGSLKEIVRYTDPERGPTVYEACEHNPTA